MTTCITEQQRGIHVVSEATALVVAAPFLFWLSAQRELPTWARGTAVVLGVATLVTDGYLLASYLRR